MFYTDDGNLVSDAEDVKTAIMALVKGFNQSSFSVHFGKSIYYDGQPVAEVGETERMRYLDDATPLDFTRAEGAKIIGRAIGTDAYVEASVAKTLSKHTRGIDVIGKLQTDVAVLLLTYCINTRPMFLARNFPAEVVKMPLAEFDRVVDKGLATIFQINPESSDGTTHWIKQE
jgi:hypothetical protein